MIHGIVRGQSLRLVYPTLVANTIAYLSATFSFEDGAWEGLSKWAHFKKGEDAFCVELVHGKITEDRHLNLPAGEWEVYLHGTETENGEVIRRIITTSQKLIVHESGTLDGEPLPVEPPSVGEQILAKAEQALSVTEGFQNAVEAQMSAIETALDEIIAIQTELIGGDGE